MEGYETVLLSIPECFVYQIPPLIKSEGHRASNWDVEKFLWKGRLRIMSNPENLIIKLEDGNTGELFAACPYDDKGIAVEQVLDSSRYFVIRVEDQGRHAYLGLGFSDRSEAFDFNVCLQDFLRHKKRDSELESESHQPIPEIDYSLKQGQTIQLNLAGKIGKKKDSTEFQSSSDTSSAPFSLPPPPRQQKSDDDFGSFQDSANQAPTGWAKFD